MTENTTNSAELRQFAADNTGRRKIDVEASLDLHRRAANCIDALSGHVNDLRRSVASGEAPAPAPAPVAVTSSEDPSQSALMILQKAQQTADQTVAEANQVLADAERTRREADALAQAKADTALAQARVEADDITAAAEVRAGEIIAAAEARAGEVAAATAVTAERVADAQRAYHAKAASLRADAEGVVALARSMENLAGEELPAALTEEPFTKPLEREPAAAAPLAAAVDAAPAEPAPTEEPVEAAAPAELPPPPAGDSELLPPPPAPDVAASELPPPPAADLLPPPPAPAPAPVAVDEDLVDLTEAELEQALGGRSIDDELFGDDVVIDLTDETDDTKSFEFFSRD